MGTLDAFAWRGCPAEAMLGRFRPSECTPPSVELLKLLVIISNEGFLVPGS
jgi:hypothetical protein